MFLLTRQSGNLRSGEGEGGGLIIRETSPEAKRAQALDSGALSSRREIKTFTYCEPPDCLSAEEAFLQQKPKITVVVQCVYTK